jgi:NADH-quinone oxidoreductase subunit C
MTDVITLAEQLKTRFAENLQNCQIAFGQITLEIHHEKIHEICQVLRDEPEFAFAELMEVCGVDYLTYGCSQWQTEATTLTGFSRAVEPMGSDRVTPWHKPRFAVVYQLLSLKHNHRVRLRTFVPDEPPLVDSVVDLWAAANWFEREAFDLYGILFKGHPDLRRILTDYGFIGHPFRKDFPLIGNVEIRYDATLERCVYEPVSIQPRILVPKVIRQDHRYLNPEEQQGPAQ